MTAEGDDVASGGDVIDCGTKLSMRGGGTFPLKMRRACWRRRQHPDAVFVRRAVVEVESSRAKSASQKPYLPSPGAGSQRRGFQRPARPVAGARKRSDWGNYGGSATARSRRGKNPSLIGCVLAWPEVPRTHAMRPARRASVRVDFPFSSH